MTKRHWLAASCALGLLAAGPVLAQTETKAATGAAMNQQSRTGSMNSPSAVQADTASSQPTRRPMRIARNTKTDTSQNAEVDRLNDQSYQAAQQGRSYSPASSDMDTARPSDMGGSNSPGGMGTMSQPGGNKM